MNFQVDVVCTYYRQMACLPFFFWGYRRNWSFIHKFYLVNDEPWLDEEVELLLQFKEWNLLDHEHNGRGVPRSINQGVAQCTSDYVFITAFDTILPPGILRDFQFEAAKNGLVVGGVDSIKEHPGVLTMRDFFDERYSLSPYGGNPEVSSGKFKWQLVNASCLLVDRKAHQYIGGMDERFVEYGCEDNEYGIRWQSTFGEKSIVFSSQRATQILMGEGKDISPHSYSLLRESFHKHITPKEEPFSNIVGWEPSK